MPTDPLADAPRLLIEAKLQPVQGTRFQPTGFPDLGAATYTLHDKEKGSTAMLLVESAQSMANRLETACLDDAGQAPHSALAGMPYVEAKLPDGTLTNSLLEAHRVNSPYLVNGPEFAELEKAIGFEKNKPFDRQKLARALFKFDPCSLVHGIFLEKVGGVVRLPRALSGFIEARNVTVAESGGAKIDRVQPESTGKNALYGKAEDGYGNVIFPRSDYCGEITAYFNLDLALIRGFGLPTEAQDFLVTLALFKVRRFLEIGLRLRTACDLDLKDLTVTRPSGYVLPELPALTARLGELIAANKANFRAEPVLRVNFDAKLAKARKDKGDKAKKVDEDTQPEGESADA